MRGVAEGYAKKSVDTEPLLDGSPFSNTGTRIYLALKTAGSVDGAIALLNGEPDGLRYAKWIEDNRNRISISGPSGNVYEQTFFTNRAPGDESHLLKWYEPVSEEQFGWIKKALKKEGVSISETKLSSGAHGLIFENEKTWRKGYTGAKAKDETVLAADVYTALKELFGSPKAASEFLARAGIDGIKYPVDSYAKSVKDGDKAGWNYVSFRDDNIRVDHKWTDGEQRFSISVGDTLMERGRFDRLKNAIIAQSLPENAVILDRTAKPQEAAQLFADHILGKTFHLSVGGDFTFNAGHFFRLVCSGKDGRKGFVDGFSSGEDAFAAILAGKVESDKIAGWEAGRARLISLVPDLLTKPSVVLEKENISQFVKRYDVGNGKTLTAVFRTFSDGRKILFFFFFFSSDRL